MTPSAGAVFDAVAGLGAIAVLAGGFDLIEDVDVLFLCTGSGDGGAVLLDRVFDDEAIFALRTFDLFADQAGLDGDHCLAAWAFLLEGGTDGHDLTPLPRRGAVDERESARDAIALYLNRNYMEDANANGAK